MTTREQHQTIVAWSALAIGGLSLAVVFAFAALLATGDANPNRVQTTTETTTVTYRLPAVAGSSGGRP